MWIYKQVEITTNAAGPEAWPCKIYDHDGLEEPQQGRWGHALNLMGAQDWELASTVETADGFVAIFKARAGEA